MYVFPSRGNREYIRWPPNHFGQSREHNLGCDFNVMRVGERSHSDHLGPALIFYFFCLESWTGWVIFWPLCPVSFWVFFPLFFEIAEARLLLLGVAGPCWPATSPESGAEPPEVLTEKRFNQQSNRFCWDGVKKEKKRGRCEWPNSCGPPKKSTATGRR